MYQLLIAFMAQVKDVENWKPLNLKYAAMVHFTKMLEVPPSMCINTNKLTIIAEIIT